MKCKKCGKKNTDNAKFCVQCGETLESPLTVSNTKFNFETAVNVSWIKSYQKILKVEECLWAGIGIVSVFFLLFSLLPLVAIAVASILVILCLILIFKRSK